MHMRRIVFSVAFPGVPYLSSQLHKRHGVSGGGKKTSEREGWVLILSSTFD
jgi:hypothetical protein